MTTSRTEIYENKIHTLIHKHTKNNIIILTYIMTVTEYDRNLLNHFYLLITIALLK